jgi:predicted AAA+ superfamily ATPase
MYLDRHLAIPLLRAAQDGEPILVQGPRGSGKTTLLRREFSGHIYVTLEDAADRSRARRDPAAFLARLRGPAVIDDFQRAPELNPHLTNLPLVLASSQRLTVGLKTFELYSPTRAERQRRPPLPLDMLGRFAPVTHTPAHELAPWPRTRRFLHDDVRRLVNVDDLDRFERFLDLAEAQSGELLHQQELARAAGVAHRTVVRWLAVLDACFLTLQLEPADDDFGRRAVRRPKLHFLEHSTNFESQVVSEIYRNARHADISPRLRYWRDSNGLEIPLLIEETPVQIAAQPTPADEARLVRWMKLARVRHGAMIARNPGLPGRRESAVLRYTASQL